MALSTVTDKVQSGIKTSRGENLVDPTFEK